MLFIHTKLQTKHWLNLIERLHCWEKKKQDKQWRGVEGFRSVGAGKYVYLENGYW